MEEEGETSTPFWIQSPTNSRRRRPLFNSGVLLFTLSVTASLFILFVIPPLLSLSPQFSRLINSFKKNWDSFNILIVLLALIIGFLSRNRNNHDSIPAVGSLDDRTDDKIRNEVHKSREYGYSDRTAVVDDQIGTDNRNEVQKSTVSGWYGYSDRTAADGLRIYPNLREISRPEDSGGRWRFLNDMSLAREADALATRANEISPPEDSGDRWRFHNGMPLAREADAWTTRANEISPREDSRNRRPYDDMSLAREADALATRANGASRVQEAQSPQLERFNEGVKVLSTGTVIGVVDGIASIRGLHEVAEGEIVEFDEGVVGIALHRESMDSVGVVLMDDGLIIREGTCVKATGKIVQIPASEDTPIDDRGEISTTASRINEGTEIKPVEENRAPPPVVRRRKRRTTGRIANKGKSSEEQSGLEPSGQSSRRKIKRTLENTGTVLEVGDGIAHIHCLDNVTEGEIIEFDEGTIGIALNPESTDNVRVVLMGDGLQIQAGSSVKATGKIAQIPVDESCLDRIVKALAKPIKGKGEISVPVSGLVEETEIKPLDDTRTQPPDVQRRTHRTARSIAEKGKTSEEVSDLEPPGQFWMHESMATGYKQSHLGSDTDESIPSKEEASEKLNDELETNEYESLFPPMLDPPISPPQSSRSERKRGGGNPTRDFLVSFRKREKKQRQKSVENLETLLDSQPPLPQPPSVVQTFFSSKKGKSKRIIDVPPPPPPPPPYFTEAHEQKSAAVEAPATTHRPPLPVKVRNFVEVTPNSSGESPLTGAESPLHPIPPPPPPPFQMPSWKFIVKGDYVKIGSANSSRSVSPERDEVDSPASSGSGWTAKAVDDSGDVASGAMFCPSPDVNSKADVFIAKFRAGLKLQKMNSIKQKQGVGLSNLGPASNPNQAQA